MKTDSDYESFYEAIDIRITPRKEKIKSYYQLNNIMDEYGFFKRYDESKWTPEKRKQAVSMAWQYLKRGSVYIEKQQGLRVKSITREKGIMKTKYFSRYDIKIKNKKYKKGAVVEEELPKTAYRIINNRGIPVKQADVSIKINGKWYRKGQFIPRKFRID